jgi:hypothetical protein
MTLTDEEGLRSGLTGVNLNKDGLLFKCKKEKKNERLIKVSIL